MDIIEYVKSLPIRSFEKDEVLMDSEDPSTKFFAVRQGFVKATTTENNGRQRLLWIAGRYDIVPLERLFTKKPLQYDYIAMTAGSAYVVDKAIFMEAAKENAAVALEIAQGLSEHFDDVTERLSAVGKIDIRSKLLHTLYNVAVKFSSSEVVHLHELGLNLTHQDLADMIGTSREVVSLEMNKVRKDGYIEYDRLRLVVNTKKIRHEMGLLA